ncbi:hypothetical protein [Thermopirellula anaerolimosa]
MAEAFDPYRDALVVEETTLWPNGTFGLEEDSRRRVERALHEQASQASDLEYVRLPTGFRREVRVAAADVERILGIAVASEKAASSGSESPSGETARPNTDAGSGPAPTPGGSPAEG